VDPDSRPTAIGPPFTGHFRVSADTPRGLQPLQPSVSVNQSIIPSVKHDVEPTKLEKIPLTTTSDVYQKRPADTVDQPSKKIKYSCATCSVGMTSRYHCLKQNIDICTPCYQEGRFPSTLFSGDFIKMDDSVSHHDDQAKWSSQENLLLLEGIEMYDDDWQKISDHVGTRTRDQCVLQFLKVFSF
jgi:SWI/SNF related-matrix-associated actin-dependent regulator of chromatin subfamily C